jgi:hypothetical protein
MEGLDGRVMIINYSILSMIPYLQSIASAEPCLYHLT